MKVQTSQTEQPDRHSHTIIMKMRTSHTDKYTSTIIVIWTLLSNKAFHSLFHASTLIYVKAKAFTIMTLFISVNTYLL